MAQVVRLPTPPAAVPWYRQFWPWFVIAVPGISVVFSVATLVIAVRHADSLVRDDYYAAGLAVNLDLNLERVAAQRRLVASLGFDTARAELTLGLAGLGVDPHAELLLRLSHPTDAARDQTLRLRAGADGVFRAAPTVPLRGPWDAVLSPAGGGWRLAGRIDFDAPQPPRLGAPG
jgi:hypothetical protein